jgi:hypothetical protein
MAEASPPNPLPMTAAVGFGMECMVGEDHNTFPSDAKQAVGKPLMFTSEHENFSVQ